MFKWLKRKQKPQSPVQVVAPQPSTVIDLRLDKSTPKQDEALASFMAWGNDLVTRHKTPL